jgi:hypothetical protein
MNNSQVTSSYKNPRSGSIRLPYGACPRASGVQNFRRPLVLRRGHGADDPGQDRAFSSMDRNTFTWIEAPTPKRQGPQLGNP